VIPLETNTHDTILGEACYRGNLTEMEENRVSDPSCKSTCMVYFYTMDLTTGNYDRGFNISAILTQDILR